MAPKLETLALERALEKPGCPVCRLVQEREERWLWIFFWERVNDVGVRAAILESGGFCRDHSWRLLRYEQRERNTGMGTAIVFEDLLAYWMPVLAQEERAVGRFKARLPGPRPNRAPSLRHRGCLLCAALHETEKGEASVLARELQDPDFRQRYLDSEGLCLPRLGRALAYCPDRATAQVLVASALARLGTLAEDLKVYLRSFDYKARADATGASGNRGESCRRAIAALAGEEDG